MHIYHQEKKERDSKLIALIHREHIPAPSMILYFSNFLRAARKPALLIRL